MPRSIKKEFPHIFIDWHPSLNGKINPSVLKRSSRKKYWWKCHNKKCGHSWQATLYSRINLKGLCPKCEGRKKGKFIQEKLKIKKIFKKIKNLQLQIDESFNFFLDINTNITNRQRKSVIIRKKIEEINKLGIEFRKIILEYKKKKNKKNI